MTFFSGTDTATLKEEGSERNHFVSLIVNNAGSYTAGITRRIKYTEKRDISYPSFDGKQVITQEEFTEAEEIEWFNLDIVFEEKKSDTFQTLASRLDSIKETKKKAEDEKKKVFTTTSSYSPANYISPYYYSGYKTEAKEPEVKEPTLFDNYYSAEDEAELKEWNKSFGIYPEEGESDDVSTKKLKKLVTPTLIKRLAAQLLTGCVLASENSIKDMDNWLVKMEERFDARFGKDDNLTLFGYWAIPFVEFIIWYAIDDFQVDEDEAALLVASKLIEYFNALPRQTKYTKEFIKLLKDYVNSK